MGSRRMVVLSCSVFLFLAAVNGIGAVQYAVMNKAGNSTGGARFKNEIRIPNSRHVLIMATDFILMRIFRQNIPTDRKPVEDVTLIIENMDGVVACTSNNEIHVSADYIGSYSGDVRREITGVLYHEMTHIWQWNGGGQAPGGLVEGIADFVRLKANQAPTHWVQPGEGDRWDQGYDVTARFLDYCNGLRSGFIAELNKKMRIGYSDNVFVEILGKTVDQLWAEYKAEYGN